MHLRSIIALISHSCGPRPCTAHRYNTTPVVHSASKIFVLVYNVHNACSPCSFVTCLLSHVSGQPTYSAATSCTHLPISFHIPSRTRSSHVPIINTSWIASLAHTIRTRTPSCSSPRSSATTSRSSRSASPTTISALGKSVNRPMPLGVRIYGLLAVEHLLEYVGTQLTAQSYDLMPSSR